VESRLDISIRQLAPTFAGEVIVGKNLGLAAALRWRTYEKKFAAWERIVERAIRVFMIQTMRG
jgi:hypothetical protein